MTFMENTEKTLLRCVGYIFCRAGIFFSSIKFPPDYEMFLHVYVGLVFRCCCCFASISSCYFRVGAHFWLANFFSSSAFIMYLNGFWTTFLAQSSINFWSVNLFKIIICSKFALLSLHRTAFLLKQIVIQWGTEN